MRILLTFIFLVFTYLPVFSYTIGQNVITADGNVGIVFYVGQDRVLLVGINEYKTSWAENGSAPSRTLVLPTENENGMTTFTGKTYTDYLKSIGNRNTFPFLSAIHAENDWYLPSYLEMCLLNQNCGLINRKIKSLGGDTIAEWRNYLCINEESEKNVVALNASYSKHRMTKKTVGKSVSTCCRAFYQIMIQSVPTDDDYSYLWNTGDVSSMITKSPTTTTTYTVTVTNNTTGCPVSASKTVLVADNGFQDVSDTICEGETYENFGLSVSETGSYTSTVKTDSCSTTVNLHLTVAPKYKEVFNDVACQGVTYSKHGFIVTPYGKGSFSDTLNFLSQMGCDSMLVLNLNVKPIAYDTIVRRICQTDEYKDADFKIPSYQNTGLHYYMVQKTGEDGCKVNHTLALQVDSVYTTSLVAEVLQGGDYKKNGFNVEKVQNDGTYSLHLKTASGCDSTVNLSIHIKSKPAVVIPIADTICEGKTYKFHGLDLGVAGIYTDSVKTDSSLEVTELTLTVNPVYNVVVTDTLCATSVSKTDEVVGTTLLQTIYGCDSTVTHKVHYNQILTTKLNETICQGSTYSFGGKAYTKDGVFTDTLTTASGCDSIVELTLSVADKVTTKLNETICEGSSFTFGGKAYTKAGVYTDTLTTASGCDSIVELTLSVADKVTTKLNETICEGSTYNFGGKAYTKAGVYTDTLTTGSGCDSIVELTLSVADKVTTKLNETICKGSTYNFGGKAYTKAGVYTDTLTTASGCDSIVELTLSVADKLSTKLNETICKGSSYNFGGKAYNKAGVYTDTLITASGCDSIVELTLSVADKVTTKLNETICEGSSYQIGNHSYTKAGLYTDTLTTSAGCDSIVELSLTLLKAVDVTLNDTICEGEEYAFAGTTKQYASGNIDLVERLSTNAGCDSTISMHLTVLPASRVELYDTATVGNSYIRNGFQLGILEKVGQTEYVLNTNNEVGCDSIVTLHLNVLGFTDNHVVPTVFSPLNHDGHNDVFMEGYEVYIYDRYGNLICHSNDGWDGMYRGAYADPGVYVYVVTLKDDHKRKGTVEVLK